MTEADISRITLEPGKRGGQPCVRGLRITVYDVLGWLASGMSEDQILGDIPTSSAPISGPASPSPPTGNGVSSLRPPDAPLHFHRVTLLFDENLSFRLVGSVSRLFPNSRHVRDVGLAQSDDRAIWEYARTQGLTIVTLDSDFHERSLLVGWPPKVIWLRIGNTATVSVESLLRRRAGDIRAFLSDQDHACLVVAGSGRSADS
jgi:predicted nuclease of predicted toxin-antitoxin system